jgi:enolase
MDKAIRKIVAREILDSRGTPTLEVEVFAGNTIGKFSVPGGASKGSHEPIDKRDGDNNYFDGMGVTLAIKNVHDIINNALQGHDVTDQKGIDKILLDLDGTENKSNLGGNTMIGVSIACAKAAAAVQGMEVYEYLRALEDIKPSRKVPLLFMNLVNGGKHAKTSLAFQEYHIVPQVEDIREALNIATKVQSELRGVLIKEFGVTSANFGDEGGFVPDVVSVQRPIEMLFEVLQKNNFIDKVKLSMDVASSSFYEDGSYLIGDKKYTTTEMMSMYKEMIAKFPIFSIEDPFHEEDFESFKQLREETGIFVVGDDLTVTNKQRLQMAIDAKSINSIIIKPNQIGTLTETLETMKLARANDIECIVSHRSGDTNDDFISDLAWAFGTFGLKAGAAQRGERVAKYNRLWNIQEHK